VVAPRKGVGGGQRLAHDGELKIRQADFKFSCGQVFG